MGHALIEEFLTGDSKEIRDLAANEAALVGFLTLVKRIDDLPDTNTRFYETPRSLYQVTAAGYSTADLSDILSEFFGPPAKAPGGNLPVSLRFDPTVKFLGGIRKDQALFLKKLKTGSFYGALWPWQRDPEKIEILMGFHASTISDADTHQLEQLVQKFLSQKKMETISEIGGQIHGISLPSFLQMSEMEGATYTLRVTSGNRKGYLYLDGGCLIGARLGDRKGNQAAYRIISWDKAAIQIEPAEPGREREIHEPLMHVMMESLKIKDEQEAEPEPPPEPEPAPEPEPELVLEMEKKEPLAIDAIELASLPTEASPVSPRPMDSAAPEPAGKPEDRSIGKQDQMSRTTKLLIVLGVVIVFAVVVTLGGNLFQKRQRSSRYDRLIADLAETKELDAQVVMLMQYIKAYPDDGHRAELESRLNDTNAEIEKRDYEKTVADVKQLPIDAYYADRALSLYTAFLTKHPQSPYAQEISEAAGGIQHVLAAAAYEDLQKASTGTVQERYAAYRGYLERFPHSTQRTAVEQMIDALAQEYHLAIEAQRVRCDEQKAWDACIAECDRFLTAFPDTAPATAVSALRREFLDKRALAALTAKAALVTGDAAKVLKIYTDYLSTNPETSQKAAILKRIDELNAEQARQTLWKHTAAFAANPANDIFSRVQRLDAFIEEHGTGPHAAAARELREQIEPQLQDAVRARQAEATRRKTSARRQAEEARLAEAAQHLQRLREQVVRQLVPVAERYADNGNGTVTDRFTGLTWCLLDSQMELGRCLTYRDARAYVQGLNTGGLSDWRMPTAGELASIYKNSPFFPDTGAGWYWTSESFARGYHRVVDVVTPAPENVFKRISKTEDSCGAVRAVHR